MADCSSWTLFTQMPQLRITEAYRAYNSPIDAVATTRKLISSVPTKYLVGLDCIVLTNLSGQPRRNRLGKVTGRGRRIPKSRSLGCYHREWKGQPPWIELYVDQILNTGRRLPLWVPFFRDYLFGETLFHELGHHVHLFIRPEYNEKEDVADEWKKKFAGNFVKKKYWFLVPLAKLYILLRKPFKRHTEK